MSLGDTSGHPASGPPCVPPSPLRGHRPPVTPMTDVHHHADEEGALVHRLAPESHVCGG